MEATSRPDTEKIHFLIGAIVLTCQDVEGCLKVALPFMGSGDATLGAAIKRHEKLRKRTLGDLVGLLAEKATSQSPHFAEDLERMVETRNQLVHHFNETYGAQIGRGEHKEVIRTLETQLANLKAFRVVGVVVVVFLAEGLTDLTFRNTSEYDQMAKLCEQIRKRVAS